MNNRHADKTRSSTLGYLFNTLSSSLKYVARNPIRAAMLLLYVQGQVVAADETSLLPIPDKKPLAYFPFNGNALDYTSQGHDGTVYGATMAEDRFGNKNSAYHFNQTYIAGPAFDFPDADRTIAFWFLPDKYYRDATRDRGGIMLGYGGSTCGTSFLAILNELNQPANSYEVQAHCGINLMDYVDNTMYGTSEWTHWALTTEYGIGTKMYVNGKLVMSDSSVYFSNTFVKGTQFVIGAGSTPDGKAPFSNAGAPFFQGVIDDVLIDDIAYSSADILKLFKAAEIPPVHPDVATGSSDDVVSEAEQGAAGFFIAAAIGMVIGMVTNYGYLGLKYCYKKIKEPKYDTSNPYIAFQEFPRPVQPAANNQAEQANAAPPARPSTGRISSSNLHRQNRSLSVDTGNQRIENDNGYGVGRLNP